MCVHDRESQKCWSLYISGSICKLFLIIYLLFDAFVRGSVGRQVKVIHMAIVFDRNSSIGYV